MRTKALVCAALPLLALTLWAAAVDAAKPRNAVRTETARDTLETARSFLKQARYAKAVVYYDLLLSRFKDAPSEAAWALYEKSYCLYKLKKYGLALQGFKSIGVLYPDETGPATLGEKMIAKIELKHAKDLP